MSNVSCSLQSPSPFSQTIRTTRIVYYWNSLPEKVVMSQSVNPFKNSYNEYIETVSERRGKLYEHWLLCFLTNINGKQSLWLVTLIQSWWVYPLMPSSIDSYKEITHGNNPSTSTIGVSLNICHCSLSNSDKKVMFCTNLKLIFFVFMYVVLWN